MKKVAILIDSTISLGRDLLRGIVQYANVQGPWLFLHIDRLGGSKNMQRNSFARLTKWQPDGIIIREEKIQPDFLELGVPLIVSSHQTPINQVTNLIADDLSIGELGYSYFRQKGFRSFGFCGYKKLKWSNERYEGFSRQLKENGIKVSLYESSKRQIKNHPDKELEVLGQWLQSLPKPLAVMGCDDRRCQQITEACKLLEISIPNSVAVLGVHNEDIICETAYPPLSSIALNTKKAGYECAKVLDKMMTYPNRSFEKQVTIQPTHVVTRMSTNIMAIEDHDVLMALEYIREHCKNNIQIQDIVEYTTVSKRVLQRKFKNTLGHSIIEEVAATRIAHITEDILQSDLTISEIATKYGYHDFGNFSRYFKRIKGVSPQDFKRTSLA